MLRSSLGLKLIEPRGVNSSKVSLPLKSLVTAIGMAVDGGKRSEKPPMNVVRRIRLVRLSLVKRPPSDTLSRSVMSKVKSPKTDQVLVFTSRSDEHTSELQSLMRLSYAVFC